VARDGGLWLTNSLAYQVYGNLLTLYRPAPVNLKDLTNGRGTSQWDGLLSLEDIARLSLSTTELVSLSACSTHLSDGYPGEGLVGMQRAFHAAGARCVVLSLWPVRDVTADTFFKAFYSRLASGSPTEVAFGETVRDFLVQRKDRVLKDVVLDVGCYLISLSALTDE